MFLSRLLSTKVPKPPKPQLQDGIFTHTLWYDFFGYLSKQPRTEKMVFFAILGTAWTFTAGCGLHSYMQQWGKSEEEVAIKNSEEITSQGFRK